MCRSKGFTGVEADNVDGYTQDSGFDLTGDDQLRFNRMLAELAHERSLTIGLKNDLDQIDDLVDEFDFAVNESCVQYRECAALTPFTAQGKPVLHVEYELSTDAFCPVTAPLGFRSIRKPVALTAPVEQCPARATAARTLRRRSSVSLRAATRTSRARSGCRGASVASTGTVVSGSSSTTRTAPPTAGPGRAR